MATGFLDFQEEEPQTSDSKLSVGARLFKAVTGLSDAERKKSLMNRVLTGTRDRTVTSSFRGDIAESLFTTGNDIFGYFRDFDGSIQSTTWAEILTLLGPVDENGVPKGVSPDTLRDMTDFEIGQLRRDLYNQFPGAGFALTADRVASLDGLGGLGLTSGGGSGRGSGSGAIAPSYIPQDPAALREQIRNYVVATTGTLNASLVDAGVASFGVADKERFNKRETANIDPWQAMKDTIRGTTEYKAIHQLRPESEDEMSWVVGRQAKLRQLGLSAERAETFGIAAAQAGATNEALTGQAEIAQQQGTGRLLEAHRESLKRSASAALGLI